MPPQDANLADKFFRTGKFELSEIVIGLVGPVGTDLQKAVNDITDVLMPYGYESHVVRVSDLIREFYPIAPHDPRNEYDRILAFMDAGDEARKDSDMALALGIAALIHSKRERSRDGTPTWDPRRAYIVNSLKHPEEVKVLKHIYGDGFVLIGINSYRDQRRSYLMKKGTKMTAKQADKLIERDEKEDGKSHGQRTRDTFHLADFYLQVDDSEERRRNSIERVLHLLFGHPNQTPTFHEYCMFMAFTSALRSADLSRQVGAVIARDEEILATGANDCPKFGGGLYWPRLNSDGTVTDVKGGRDYTLGHDSNDKQKLRIIEGVLKLVKDLPNDKVIREKLRNALVQSPLDDITEYGRMVHAEMEAIMVCARNGISCTGATLYCTTFPCHNCAKHIIAAGITRVVYVEPYHKSKALEFHADSAYIGPGQSEPGSEKKVYFEPFVGVGARRFFDLFSMTHGPGYPLKRKNPETGDALRWKESDGILRTAMLPWSYLQREELAANQFYLQHMGRGKDGKESGKQSSSSGVKKRRVRRGTQGRK